MPLELELQTSSAIPLEVDSIQLAAVRERTADEVAQILIQRGNRQVALGEFFRVQGSAAEDETIVWRGNCEKVKLIGARWSRGTIRVEGNCGMHLGAEMTGGEILVEGHASDWVGAEMKGGLIRVRGNAGHLVGAVYRGGRKGMTGGEILIEGNVGNEVGHTMRRGLIAVGGTAGDVAGVGMIAGTILIFGEAGIRHGAGMKRGTIGLFQSAGTVELLPTFRLACQYQPRFLELYLQHLRSLRFPLPEAFQQLPLVRRYCGDLLETGKGEILTLAR